MSAYWMISIPSKGNPEIALSELTQNVEPFTADLLTVPSFKIGSLDELLNSSESLAKLDVACQVTVSKITESMIKLSEIPKEEYEDYFFVEDLTPDKFIRNFRWNTSKYQVETKISDTAEKINKDLESIGSALKIKLAQLNNLKSVIGLASRKQTGNLSVKSLNGIVQRSHLLEGSEFMKTVFVAVPKNSEKLFLNCYETLSQMVVPRSATKIASDQEYILYSVIMFNRVVGDFTTAAKEKKFIVREFEFSEEQIESELELERKKGQAQEELIQFLEWSQSSFSDLFSGWFHVKVLRLYVESLLRYGLPPDFVSIVVEVPTKIQRQLKTKLNKAYAQLDNSGNIFDGMGLKKPKVKKSDNLDINEFNSILDEYSPFVIFELDLNQSLLHSQ
ncbi:V-type proton ATPase subunit C [Smittium mucronatum]|uniref:V-type proton ATPase subunit C n=1 Tax=Smittium mucronatum TaxID=133383 RepID=A0A1R0H527_9FUNG|nr:V-type proton ATPase subunit C [Smittium mucronatum]